MRDITVDPVTRTAVVPPGLFNAEVKKAVAQHDLWYPPDPSSFEICSIGGNIATNAGGLCCVKYGVTTDYVMGLQVVLADGTVVRVGGPRLKDVAGLSLTKLFVGSEGTLGVITEVTLRLLPPAEGRASTVVASFNSVAAAADAVARRHRADPAVDARVHGRRRRQRRRGQAQDGPRPQRGGDDGRGVRRPRRGRHRGRRVHRARCSPNTVRRRCSRPPTPTRARPSSRRGASPSRRRGQGLAAAGGCRGAAARAGRPGAPASRRSPPSTT